MKRKNNKKLKEKVYSCYSYKLANGRPVILIDEAIDYVKKQGYMVYPKVVLYFLFTPLWALLSSGSFR